MGKRLTLEELKGLVNSHCYDDQMGFFDLDRAFDLLIKLGLLNTKGTIEIGSAAERKQRAKSIKGGAKPGVSRG